jgi:hypothetical protein
VAADLPPPAKRALDHVTHLVLAEQDDRTVVPVDRPALHRDQFARGLDPLDPPRLVLDPGHPQRPELDQQQSPAPPIVGLEGLEVIPLHDERA